MSVEAALEQREAGRHAEAAAGLRAWLSAHPRDAQAHAHLAQVLSLAQQHDAARGAINGALSLGPDDPVVLRNHARLLLRERKQGEAVQAATAAWEAAPEDPENQVVLASALGPQESGRALALLAAALARRPAFAEALATRAVLHLRGGNAAMAVQDAQAALALKPHLTQLVPLLVHAAGMLVEAGPAPASLRALMAALRHAPQDAGVLQSIANHYAREQRWAQAEEWVRRTLLATPGEVHVMCQLAAVLDQQKRPAQARAVLEEALAAHPGHAMVLHETGVHLGLQKQWAQAGQRIRRALLAQPGFAKAHASLAACLKEQGLFAQAVDEAERALHLSPGMEEAQIVFCEALYAFSRADPSAARVIALRASEAFSGDAVLLRGIAGILGDRAGEGGEAGFTKLLFNRFAPDFDATVQGLGYDMPLRIATLLGLSAMGESRSLDVLDAGCGTGLCGEYLRPVARVLTGVDLSARMIALARAKGLHDFLHEQDLAAFMLERAQAFDLVVAADVLPYVGEVAQTLRAAANALRAGGRLAFSAERMQDQDAQATFALRPSGRYQHARDYLVRCCEAAGLAVMGVETCAFRQEYGKPVWAWVVLAAKPG
ncbi:MAG: methyltransferase domain-containing protein [Burkholderiales bacterium]|nr:methyltransferase domain-containing protein [Burkholderiales bacterium]